MTDPNSAREPGSGQTRRQSEASGGTSTGRLSPFLRRRVETETDMRDRIARAIADADPTADDAPHRYQRMADAAMDAMEADR